MPTVQESDIIGKAAATMTATGFTHKRGFHIDGLTSDAGIFYQAYQALGSVGVTYGAAHPKITGLYVSSINFEPFPNARTAVYAVAQYDTPQAHRGTPQGGSTVIRVTSSNGTTVTKHDTTGKILQVDYVDPNAALGPNPQLHDYAELQIESPGTCIEFIRQETGSPLLKSRLYRRKVNSVPIWGFNKNELLCRAVDSELLGLAGSSSSLWNVTYRFEGGKDVDDLHSIHHQLHIFVNRDNGRIPDGIDPTTNPTSGNGFGWYMPYLSIDFAGLNLPDPSV